MGAIAGIIRFDRESIIGDKVSSLKHLLKHRGEVDVFIENNILLLTFGGNIENKSTSLVAVADADVYESGESFEPFCNNYLKDGAKGIGEMNADFSAVIFDKEKKRLFCFRDIMGIKPLYYAYKPNCYFAFATEIKALRVFDEIQTTPNKSKFREYLSWSNGFVPYNNQTFYQSIYSVLPAHYLEVSFEKITERPYWITNSKKYSHLTKDSDFSEIFRAHFISSVNNRIANRNKIASHLSGGLDSSSVSSVAQSLLIQQRKPSLNTFHIDTGQPFADEHAYVQAVVDKWKPNHREVKPLPDILDAIKKINYLFDRPEHFVIPASFHLSVSLGARETGCDVILTGHDGDSIVPNGMHYIDRLFATEQWQDFEKAVWKYIAPRERNLSSVSNRWEALSSQVKFEKFVISTFGPDIKRQLSSLSIFSALSNVRQHKKQFDLSTKTLISYVINRLRDRLISGKLVQSILIVEFEEATSQATQSQLNAHLMSQAVFGQFALLHNATNINCNEELNHLGAYYGHQYAFPFFDKNVIEIGLLTPDHIQFNNGFGRALIRNGLQDFLPASVLSRVTKANFVEYGTQSTLQLYAAVKDSVSEPSHAIWKIADRKIFDKMVKFIMNTRIPPAGKSRYNFLISRIIYLSIWLDSLDDVQ